MRIHTAAACLLLVLSACASTPSPSSQASPGPSLAPAASAGTSSAPVPAGPSDIGQVIADEALVLRSAPGTGSDSAVLPEGLHPGMRFRILEGPVSASGYEWYRLQVGDLAGWAAAGSAEGEPSEPWLARVTNGPIAASADSGGAGGVPQVMLFEPEGGQISQLTSLDEADLLGMRPIGNVLALTCGTGVYQMVWSRDAKTLAFVFGSCDSAIFVVALDGRRERQVAEGRSFSWSPDGARLAFSLNSPFLGCTDPGCDAGPWELQVVELGDGSTHPVTRSDPFVVASAPDWSPDGETVAFAVNLVAEEEPSHYAVWVVDSQGREREVAPGFQPHWSPDGSRLLVQHQESAQSAPELRILSAEEGDDVPMGPGYDAQWSPDGDLIAYWRDAPNATVVVAQADGTELQVASLAGRFLGWSPDGQELLIGAEDGLWRYPLFGGEPVRVWDAPSPMSAAWQPILQPLQTAR